MKITTSSEIWTIRPSQEELDAAAFYASISMPWTYNRMSLNRYSKAQQSRALNIAKGIVVQEALQRKLKTQKASPEVQEKSHRDQDIFDIRLNMSGRTHSIDIKSFHVYTDFLSSTGREPITEELIFTHRHYGGPDWRHFFPMLVPHDQIGTKKDAYVFAISTSVDPRKEVLKQRASSCIAAFPYHQWMGFLSSTTLCAARESVRKGFTLEVYFESRLSTTENVRLYVIGEWDKKRQVEEISLKHGKKIIGQKPFSAISAFRLRREDYIKFRGKISISVSSNDFRGSVPDGNISNANWIPDTPLIFERNDFCNLVMPSDFIIYFIGWISTNEFMKSQIQYLPWMAPSNAQSTKNQIWDQISSRENSLMRQFPNHFLHNSLQGGWMRKGYQSSGACCYMFPNIGKYGGVKETNLYVVPGDLNRMSDLIE